MTEYTVHVDDFKPLSQAKQVLAFHTVFILTSATLDISSIFHRAFI